MNCRVRSAVTRALGVGMLGAGCVGCTNGTVMAGDDDAVVIPTDGGANDATVGEDASGPPLDAGAPVDASHDAGDLDGATDAGLGAEAGTDASIEEAGVVEAGNDAGGLFCVNGDAGEDAAANLLQAQPGPSDWDDSFGGGAHNFMTSTIACGSPATHWVESNVLYGAWIKIYPLRAPFNANIQSTMAYTASVTLAGTGAAHVDIWDGGGDGGAGDHFDAPVTLTSTPATLSVPFTRGAGAPEFQIRIDGAGVNDVDMTIWDVSIVAN